MKSNNTHVFPMSKSKQQTFEKCIIIFCLQLLIKVKRDNNQVGIISSISCS